MVLTASPTVTSAFTATNSRAMRPPAVSSGKGRSFSSSSDTLSSTASMTSLARSAGRSPTRSAASSESSSATMSEMALLSRSFRMRSWTGGSISTSTSPAPSGSRSLKMGILSLGARCSMRSATSAGLISAIRLLSVSSFSCSIRPLTSSMSLASIAFVLKAVKIRSLWKSRFAMENSCV